MTRGETFGVIEIGQNLPHYRFECRLDADDTNSSGISAVDLNIDTDSQWIRFILQFLIVGSEQVSIQSIALFRANIFSCSIVWEN